MPTGLARAVGAGTLLVCLTASAHAAFDAEFAKGPCPLIADSAVARTFGLPANATIGHTNVKLAGLSCSFDWDDKHQLLVAKVRLQEKKSVKQAADAFERSTRSMTKEDMARAAEVLRQRMEKSGQNSSTKAAGNALIGAATREPIVFEDVRGVGDEARYDASDEGTLVVRKGKNIYRITAYYGAQMSGSRDLKHHKQWLQDTRAQRKQQAVELARAVLKAAR